MINNSGSKITLKDASNNRELTIDNGSSLLKMGPVGGSDVDQIINLATTSVVKVHFSDPGDIARKQAKLTIPAHSANPIGTFPIDDLKAFMKALA